MEWMWLIVAAPILMLVFGAFANASKTNAFASLGEIPGKTLADITGVVGQPTSASAVDNGTLYQWMGINGGSSYHYAILFDPEGKAVGFTHQHVS